MRDMLQAAAFGLPAIAFSIGLAYWAENRSASRKPKAKRRASVRIERGEGGKHVNG